MEKLQKESKWGLTHTIILYHRGYEMVSKESNPYRNLLGNFTPIWKNRIIFNVGSEKGVYWSLLSVEVWDGYFV